ncbi:hypothetical protein [Rhizobium gallicum]|uniref:hypothetical protein n=1 Tax=Rhizobium gallicum TaxID=56730 RepID=UPI0012EBB37F|nr:hypothetical protein [Rhizobium gallicum]
MIAWLNLQVGGSNPIKASMLVLSDPEMGYSAFAPSSTVSREVQRFELMIERGLFKQPQASGKEAQQTVEKACSGPFFWVGKPRPLTPELDPLWGGWTIKRRKPKRD